MLTYLLTYLQQGTSAVTFGPHGKVGVSGSCSPCSSFIDLTRSSAAAEIARISAFHGRSMSLISIPIESPYIRLPVSEWY